FGPWLLPINDAFRAIPMLVLLFFFFYFPYQEALGIQPLDELSAALAALTFSQTAFTADLVRAALNNVSPDITLAGRALGLKSHIIMLKLVLPDVLRQILPTLVAFYIGNIKLSSLASVLGCRELVFVAKVAMGQTYRALEAWSIVGLIYIVMIVPLAWVSRKLESSTWIKRRS
ncbi:MAG: ABC transporter permease subunit, partial [Myxococcales bacterium]|nr:ABC transporter permease subunit [Myxococcales bacterium]